MEPNNLKVLAILQARTSSSRLPNKVLLPLHNAPMIIQQVKRLKRSKLIDKLIVATSVEASDLKLVELLKQHAVDYYQGSLDNVLDRFYQAAHLWKPEHIVRLTGDCPLTDPDIIDRVVEKHLQCNADYTSNVNPPTFPDGLDIEIMTFSALKHSWENAQLKSDKEHVTPFIKKHPELFKIENYEASMDYSHMRWTVDEPEDFEFVKAVYSELYYKNKDFNYNDILQLIKKNKQIEKINNKFVRNEGYLKSLKKDVEKDLK